MLFPCDVIWNIEHMFAWRHVKPYNVFLEYTRLMYLLFTSSHMVYAQLINSFPFDIYGSTTNYMKFVPIY